MTTFVETTVKVFFDKQTARDKEKVMLQIKVIEMGTVYAPEGAQQRSLWRQTEDRNADRMNDIFRRYFGLNPDDRYMGSFPYPDRQTNRCKIDWALAMPSREMRDTIVACMRAAIHEGGLLDITITKANDSSDSTPYSMTISAMGPSVTDNLIGEQRVQAALDLLESWLTR